MTGLPSPGPAPLGTPLPQAFRAITEGLLPMVAGAAIMGALSVFNRRAAQQPDHFVFRNTADTIVAAAGAMVGAGMVFGLLPKPPAVKRRIGPKDWSPRTGKCLCRRHA